MKSKVLENKRIKEEKLIASALELFSTNDIKDITIQDIVDKAGIAKGTFYLYFNDKYHIQNELIYRESKNLFKNASRKLEESQITDFEEQMIFLIDQVLNSLETNPFILRFIKRNLSWGVFHSQMNAVIEDDEFNILEKFKKLADIAGYHFDDPDTTFFIIIELVGSTSYSSIIDNQPKPINEFKVELFKCIRSILQQGKVEQ